MVDMAAFKMREQAPLETNDFNALNRNQLLRPKLMMHDRVAEDSRICVGRQLLRVLIVDAEQNSADALVGLVRRWGYAARVARDGHAALRMAAIQHPDVVLLDIELLDVNGCQVSSHLRFDFPRNDFIIIAFTERADDERRQHCIEAGIDLLLTKPIDLEVVETLLLLECLHVYQSQTDNASDEMRFESQVGTTN
jgi:CheY-like chemotaxis protein